MDAPPDSKDNRHHQRHDRDVRVELNRQRLVQSLDDVSEQSQQVIADSDHRQSFDGLLQPKLQLGAAVHGLQEIAVLCLKGDINASPQQVACPGNATAQCFDAPGQVVPCFHGRRKSGDEIVRKRLNASDAADAHRILAGSLEDGGWTPGGGRLGHGLGLTLTEWPSFTPKDHTPLRAGMVLTLEPSVQLAPGRILVHEEDIVLRDTGPERLSRRAGPDITEIPL